MDPDIQHYPVALFGDRYQGCYSGGRWLAVSSADELIDGEKRASWILDHGPFGEDGEAQVFWDDPPTWITVGNTPEEALARLLKTPKA